MAKLALQQQYAQVMAAMQVGLQSFLPGLLVAWKQHYKCLLLKWESYATKGLSHNKCLG